MSRTPQPAALAGLTASTGRFVSHDGLIFNIAVTATVAAIGLVLLLRPGRLLRPTLILAAAACLADWVAVQDLGFVGGLGTDPNSMIPLLLLLACGYLALTHPRPQVAPQPRQRLAVAFAGLSARGLLALWAASLVALPLGTH